MNPPPTNQDVIEGLNQILRSNAFNGKRRLKEILQYLVQCYCKDTSSTELTIAAEVFHKDSEKSKKNDSAVRNWMVRMRSTLANYYGSEGAESYVKLEIPEGAYTLTAAYHHPLPPRDQINSVISHQQPGELEEARETARTLWPSSERLTVLLWLSGFHETLIDHDTRLLRIPPMIVDFLYVVRNHKFFVTLIGDSYCRLYPIASWLNYMVTVRVAGQKTTDEGYKVTLPPGTYSYLTHKNDVLIPEDVYNATLRDYRDQQSEDAPPNPAQTVWLRYTPVGFFTVISDKEYQQIRVAMGTPKEPTMP